MKRISWKIGAKYDIDKAIYDIVSDCYPDDNPLATQGF